jgi:spore maturation protein CgeB
LDERELRSIGQGAQERVLASHTCRHRAMEFEREVENALRDEHVSLANSEAG